MNNLNLSFYGIYCWGRRLSQVQHVFVEPMLCTTSTVHNFNRTELHCAQSSCVVHCQPALWCTRGTYYTNVFSIFWGVEFTWKILQTDTFCPYYSAHLPILLQFSRWVHSKHTEMMHKGLDTEYSHLVAHNVHTNQGWQCSSVLTYTLVVHNVALYWLAGAHDDLSCLFSATTCIMCMVHIVMLSV